ncbi:MAG: Do family serine endopeptidase [Sphingomonadales bacterium]
MSQPASNHRRIVARQQPMAWIGAIAAALVLFTAAAVQARPAPDSFADLAESLLPSVVNISTTQVARGRFGDNRFRSPQFPPGSPFEEFFKEFFDRNLPGNRGDGGGNDDDNSAPRVTSLGSGFIIDPSGLIVTNNHVIAEAEEISVTMRDGTEASAEIVGRDPRTDIALLKVKVDHPLPAVRFGDSKAARVGDWVMAIGNPYGLGGTVTVGIISARGRNINATQYDDFIQVDAPINRGNSGGPLFNLDGDVIGINTAIYSPSGGSVGIGFSIPTSLAEKIVADLKQFGKPRRGWLGVTIQLVTEEIAESLGLDKAGGAMVTNVVEGDPADKAGIITGDVILEFNGHEIEDQRALQRVVAETPIDRKVPVVVWRNGKRKKLRVIVGKMDEEETEVASLDGREQGDTGDDQVSVLGMVLTRISPSMRERLQLDEGVEGVLVTNVKQNSNAAQSGVRRGDIIVEAAQVKVGNPGAVQKQIEKVRDAQTKSILLGLRREGAGFIYVAIRLEDS